MIVAVRPLIEMVLAMSEISEGDAAIEDFDFQSAMEAFAFALGLWVIRPAVDDIDAQTQKPDTESSKSSSGIGTTPRGSIIAKDAIGKAVARKGIVEGGLDVRTIERRTGFEAKEIAGVIVEQSQRMTAAAAA